MHVKLFSAIIQPGTLDADAFELEANTWLDENPDIEILRVDVSSSERDGRIALVVVMVYEELDGEEETDEIRLTIPNIGSLSKLGQLR
jgi:hypothetical protein